jgi:hypothetical protein
MEMARRQQRKDEDAERDAKVSNEAFLSQK